MTKILREDADIKVETLVEGDAIAPFPADVKILENLESEKALLIASMSPRPIKCQIPEASLKPLIPFCIGSATYEISKTCGLNFIKKAICNGTISGVPTQAGGENMLTKVKCTAEGNTKTIFVTD